MHSSHTRFRKAVLISSALALVAVSGAQAHKAKYAVLYGFNGGSDGAHPQGGVALDPQGNIFGTTLNGGSAGSGTVFELPARGAETVLHAFTGSPDGSGPISPLTTDADSNFYGTADSGGAQGGNGVLFRMAPDGAVAALHTFPGSDGGANPAGAIVRDASGNLFGTTQYQGDGNCQCGVVYELSFQGVFSILHTFTGGSGDGAFPAFSGLTADGAGNLYGTTAGGGDTADCNGGCGTVFRLTPAGVYSKLYAFRNGSDGANPVAGVTVDANGTLYGTTFGGGSGLWGTVFKLAAAKNGSVKESILYNFSGGNDGGNPYAAPILDSKGNLYGTTLNRGAGGQGLVYKLSRKGVETVLHAFTGGDDGAFPYSALTMDNDGFLYGTTYYGGNANCGCGAVFQVKR